MVADPLKVLIVDDSALYRQSISAAISQIEGIQIVGMANNGAEALEKIRDLQPDLLTLDVEMPIMNGIETLRQMNKHRFAARAIMVSSLTEAGARVTLDALFEGAFDFVAKPRGGPIVAREKLQASLAQKFDAFRIYRSQQQTSRYFVPSVIQAPVQRPLLRPDHASSKCEAVLIGISTGGPKALRHVLPRLDAEFPCPVIVVQHMPADYTSMMAERLNQECSLPMVEAKDGELIKKGKIYLAPGGHHLSLVKKQQQVFARLTLDAAVHSCRPSVDYTIERAVNVYDGKLLVVIMTGMGRDGVGGCELAKSCGATIFTQDAETSAVYGMPKAVKEAGIADRILPLGKIAAAITRHVNRSL